MLLALSGCQRKPEEIEPKINYLVQDRYLKELPSPFPLLTEDEKKTAWGQEYLIGLGFAHQLDLYQAITAFRRSLILIPASETERRLELQYEVLLCYYLGKKYYDVMDTFETSDLKSATPTFPACHDLLIILYDASLQLKDPEKTEKFFNLIALYYPEEVEKLSLSKALSIGDFPALQQYAPTHPEVKDFLAIYEKGKKSAGTAKGLNAVLPGAGYFYLGQPQTGVTALVLNGLFIAATVHFFQKREIAAGIIFAGFEAGWYFGGIYGAGEEAKYYNERLYEKNATPFMNQYGYFPVFSLQYAF